MRSSSDDRTLKPRSRASTHPKQWIIVNDVPVWIVTADTFGPENSIKFNANVTEFKYTTWKCVFTSCFFFLPLSLSLSLVLLGRFNNKASGLHTFVWLLLVLPNEISVVVFFISALLLLLLLLNSWIRTRAVAWSHNLIELERSLLHRIIQIDTKHAHFINMRAI